MVGFGLLNRLRSKPTAEQQLFLGIIEGRAEDVKQVRPSGRGALEGGFAVMRVLSPHFPSYIGILCLWCCRYWLASLHWYCTLPPRNPQTTFYMWRQVRSVPSDLNTDLLPPTGCSPRMHSACFISCPHTAVGNGELLDELLGALYQSLHHKSPLAADREVHKVGPAWDFGCCARSSGCQSPCSQAEPAMGQRLRLAVYRCSNE